MLYFCLMQKKQIIRKACAIFILSLFFFTVTSFKMFKHPFYISVTEIRMDSGKKEMSISCKLFIDDLQQALNHLFHVKVNLQKQDSLTNRLLSSYVKSHLKIKLGQQWVQYNLIGFELEEEACWCYFEAKQDANNQVTIENTLLYDLIEAQSNFVHCIKNQERKTAKLVNPEKELHFYFE